MSKTRKVKIETAPTDEQLNEIGVTREEFDENLEIENEELENVVADMEFVREELEQKEATDEEIAKVLNEFSLIKYHAALYHAWLNDDVVFNIDESGNFQVVDFTGSEEDCPHCNTTHEASEDVKHEPSIVISNEKKTLN